MKSSNVSILSSRLIVFSLLISLVSVQTMFATSPGKAVAAAEITVNGTADAGEKPFVEVNGERAFSGRSFFSNGTVATTDTSSATISLGKLGRIYLAPASSLSLDFTDGRISGVLSKGNVSVASTDGVSVKIDTPNDSIATEGTASSRFTVSVVGDRTGVAVENGAVRSSDGAKIAGKQDDDDDDDDYSKIWWGVGIAAAVAAVIIIVVVTSDDDDDDTVSPIR